MSAYDNHTRTIMGDGIMQKGLATVSGFTAFNFGMMELVDVNLLTGILGTGEALTVSAAGILVVGAYQMADETGLKNAVQERNK